MRFEKLDLNLLTVLDAVLDEKSINRAARRLHLSQPAMSNALRRLRDYLGDPLLIRTGGAMVLTPRAESLRHSVRHILEQIRYEITVKPAFDPETSDRLFVITASDYTIRTLLIPAFAHFNVIAPGLRFRVTPLGGDVTEDFNRGETDLLIAPSQIISKDHPGEVIFQDDYVVAAWAGNPLIGDTLDADTYFALGHVNATFGQSHLPAFDEWINQRTDRVRKLEISLPSFRDVPEMLVGSRRIATMHRRFALDFAGRLPLKLFAMPFACPHLTQIAQWHRLRNDDPGLRWLIDELKSLAARDFQSAMALPVTST